MLLLCLAASHVALTYFVSPQGNDTASGKNWKTSFATLQHAVDTVGTQPGTIHVRGKVQTTPIQILNAKNLKIVGENHASLTTALSIEGWQKDTFNGNDCWSALLIPSVHPYELFVGADKQRAPEPRLPKQGFFKFAEVRTPDAEPPWNEGQNYATYRPDDVPNLSHPEEIEAVVHQMWVTSNLPIAQIDPDKHAFRFAKKSVFRMYGEKASQPTLYYLDNVREAFSEPGQWFWDAKEGRIYYLPRPTDNLRTFTAETPTLGPILTIKGCDGVEIRNLEFTGSEFRYPDSASGDGQAATSVPAAVQIIDCQNCLLAKDTVQNCATYGFEVSGTSSGNKIQRCDVTDVGAGGVKIGHGTSATTVTDCSLTHLGKVYPSAIGIWIGNSGHNVISHCRIADSGYTGISVGWTWGYGKSDAVDNLIEDNDIRDLGHGELSDMGGIYTLGVSPGTILRHNRIDHVRCTYYGGWGIYLDEGTSKVVVEDNLVTDCQTGNFHQHYGADNLIQNNIFAFAPTIAQVIRNRSEDHTSFTMDRNIFIWNGTPLLGGNLDGSGIGFNHNLVWQVDGTPLLPKQGMGNVNKEPLFANEMKGDFHLSPASPALDLGFKPFPLTGFGPRQG